MQWAGEFGLVRPCCSAERRSKESLHVATTAAVKPAALAGQNERIRVPGLARHRHHIAVARKH